MSATRVALVTGSGKRRVNVCEIWDVDSAGNVAATPTPEVVIAPSVIELGVEAVHEHRVRLSERGCDLCLGS